jgi:hypothetical protein
MNKYYAQINERDSALAQFEGMSFQHALLNEFHHEFYKSRAITAVADPRGAFESPEEARDAGRRYVDMTKYDVQAEVGLTRLS